MGNIGRRTFLKGICALALSITSCKEEEPLKQPKRVKRESPKLSPYLIPWKPNPEQTLQSISFDPKDYQGNNIATKVKGKFFASNIIKSSELSDIIEGAYVFDIDNKMAYNLPTCDEMIKKVGYKGKIGINLRRLGSDGTCLYDLRKESGETIGSVVANIGAQKLYLFINEDSKLTWDFANFWLSQDGKTGRAMIKDETKYKEGTSSEKEVIFYPTNNAELGSRDYGKLEAISGDGNVVIYRNDDTNLEGYITNPHYFIFDEERIDFASCFRISPGDEMTYKLSETGKSLLQRSHWNTGRVGLRVGRKTSGLDVDSKRRGREYEFINWLKGFGTELGPLTIYDDGTVDNGKLTIPFSDL